MKRRRFSTLIRVAVGFAAILGLLLFERMGIQYGETLPDLEILPYDQVMHVKDSKRKKTCLLIYDSGSPNSVLAHTLYDQVLTDMRVPFETLDVREEGSDDLGSTLADYRTLVLSMGEFDIFGENILEIPRWVGKGGLCLFGTPPNMTDYFNLISGKLGIVSSEFTFGIVDSFKSDPDYMLGSQMTYTIVDAYDAAAAVELDEKCKVYASTKDDEIPLVWSRDYKDGKFVCCNFGYTEKAYRGIFSSAYSLLEDVFAYPVINGSTFYLDDFPSPVPSGDGKYVMRDYHMRIADFYSTRWWPDVLKLGEKHNIKYTGLIIETYEDKTYGDLPSNDSTADYYYYGNMLLNKGGELGYHGYNHQPLCPPSFVYEKDLGYKTWESEEKMYEAFKELNRFSKSIFPSADLQVYVPPSDILSEEGRRMLGEDFPELRCIASIYFTGKDEYSQEFTVAEDGIIETPRTISGGIFDDYMMVAALSEMNFHYVSSHFMHPDDLLDEDRGAAEGWEVYKNNLDNYMTWVDESSVNNIRHLTGSGIGGAVQRYVNVIPELSVDTGSATLNTEGLVDSVYYLVRVNDGTLGEVYGGELTKLNDTLYLLRAQSEKVVMIRR